MCRRDNRFVTRDAVGGATHYMKDANTYDAIVIGSGISGGWAAKELCQKGLKTLVLERGRNIEHIKDYPTYNKNPWEFAHRNRITQQALKENPLISKAAGYGEGTAHFFVKDADHPYIQQKPFDWIRGYQVGGKSLTWGRSCQRWSDWDFSAPLRYGYGIDWPIRYNDIAPWDDREAARRLHQYPWASSFNLPLEGLGRDGRRGCRHLQDHQRPGRCADHPNRRPAQLRCPLHRDLADRQDPGVLCGLGRR